MNPCDGGRRPSIITSHHFLPLFSASVEVLNSSTQAWSLLATIVGVTMMRITAEATTKQAIYRSAVGLTCPVPTTVGTNRRIVVASNGRTKGGRARGRRWVPTLAVTVSFSRYAGCASRTLANSLHFPCIFLAFSLHFPCRFTSISSWKENLLIYLQRPRSKTTPYHATSYCY